MWYIFFQITLFFIFNFAILHADPCEHLKRVTAQVQPDKTLRFVPLSSAEIAQKTISLKMYNLILDRSSDFEKIARILTPLQSKLSVNQLADNLRQRVFSSVQGEILIPLEEISPEILRGMTDKTSGCEGPNCWNATLNWFFPGLGIKYTSQKEMDQALSDPRKFIKLKPGAEIRFGDVIVFRSYINGLTHTAVYIDDWVVWHKWDFLETSKYELSTLDEVMKKYYYPVLNFKPEISFYRFVPTTVSSVQ